MFSINRKNFCLSINKKNVAVKKHFCRGSYQPCPDLLIAIGESIGLQKIEAIPLELEDPHHAHSCTEAAVAFCYRFEILYYVFVDAEVGSVVY